MDLLIIYMPVFHNKAAMWSRKQSVCSALSGVSKGDEPLTAGIRVYPFAVALRVRVLQIVCGIGGLVVGAVGWLEEKQKPALGLGVPAGAITVVAAIYFSRGFGGWNTARSRTSRSWGGPWRVLGPAPCAAVPLTALWTVAIAAHIAMLAICIRTLMNLGCNSTTCVGVAVAQLVVSISTLAATVYMLQLDLRFDPAVTPPRPSDAHTAVSMVPLTSVAVNSGNSGDGEAGSPFGKDKNSQSPQIDPT
ncbi:uncharacterized protein LOC106712858 isoform X2 [Papilio machaon]|uniref:uncharacterized protein LOC106712858 isoform X2 n=1 Tax=Papilio machaon TaxID=76193 RepID=UPI001E662ADE|nr:uncharacterized protein LOC106712858 isoform X2 [Papilio machaon]